MKRMLPVVILAASLAAVGCGSSSQSSAPSTSEPAWTMPVIQPSYAATPGTMAPVESAEPSGPLSEFSDGTYEVGTGNGQIAPGKYKSPGSNGGAMGCYWARMKDDSGSVDDVIASDYTHGPAILTVRNTDKYVKVENCEFSKA
jgi:hypothetical protein